jgi:hypothetical protein
MGMLEIFKCVILKMVVRFFGNVSLNTLNQLLDASSDSAGTTSD